ncbi:MAG: hypothetical protein ACE14L_12650 [Terriglobales bacterium]
MMLAYRLVRLIETHSEQLATGLLNKIEHCDKCRDFSNVSHEEFKQRVVDIYYHLGEWLLGKSERDIERHYCEIGQRRAHQGVPISQLIWAIALTKENLVEFLQDQVPELKPMEILGELEIMQLLEQFFDRATYYAALGHEQALVAHPELAAAAHHN